MSEPWIVSAPKIMLGKPILAGTRITVDLIFQVFGLRSSIRSRL